MDLTIGHPVGDYEVLAVLGAGGMGKVYKVRSTITERIEAMKILLPDLNATPDLAERFLREIRISAALQHPNIAALRTAQRIDNQLVMVMEFVDGSPLTELMRNSRLSLTDSLKYISQALSALEYAHAHGVIHRDIKPANIMISAAGEVKLMDFGIAKLATDASMTRTGMMVGSVPYMSPEQIEGREIDGRSDIYSLGITFYEMVTGKRPFDGKSDFEIMSAHLTLVPQPPRDLDPFLPKPVNEVILTAMAKNPTDRFATAGAMRNAVNSLSSTEMKPAPAVGQQSVPPVSSEALNSRSVEPKRAQEAPPAIAMTAPPKNNRTAYMLAGSLVTVAVLIGGMVMLPRLFSTKGSDKTVLHEPVEKRPAKLRRTEEPSLVEERGERVHEKTQSETKFSDEVTSKRARSDAQLERRSIKPVQIPEPEAKSAETSLVSEPISEHKAEKSAADQNSPELAALRDRMALMNTRVWTVRGSLDNLKQSLARSGLGLRRDMVEAQQRLTHQMGQAEESLNANNAVGAQKWLDRAEDELEKLESFLGN